MIARHGLRQTSFHAIESLVRSPAHEGLGLRSSFGDDTFGYFTERLDPSPIRRALVTALQRAKRNNAFDASPRIGLALDGTTVGRSRCSGCERRRPFLNAGKEIAGYRHHLARITVTGAGLTLPFDVEPFGPVDSEYAAGQRLLRRVMPTLGPRFVNYLVVDAGFATSTFLHATASLGLPVVARLKDNLPELSAAVEKRFGTRRPSRVLTECKDRVELWDADDFDPWETLDWETVRVVRYRQTKPDGSVVEAEWLTDLPTRQASSLAVYRIAKSRWEIENEGFNDCKTHHGFRHICHHHANSLLVTWLLTLLAVVLLRLYRLRYLHRGNHPVHSAIQLVRLFWLALSPAKAINSS